MHISESKISINLLIAAINAVPPSVYLDHNKPAKGSLIIKLTI